MTSVSEDTSVVKFS